jgi:hypothetical protein
VRKPGWIDREPGLLAALHELTRVLRRARRRWIITLLVAAGVTSLLVYQLANKPQTYSSRAILRMSEGEFADTRMSLRQGDLEDYLWNVVFSQKIVYPILEELDLYSDMRALGVPEAVEAFREDVDVAVFGNFFLKAGTLDKRTVRVAITYRSLDPMVTVQVVERLADEVIEHERERHIRGHRRQGARRVGKRIADARRARGEMNLVKLEAGPQAHCEGQDDDKRRHRPRVQCNQAAYRQEGVGREMAEVCKVRRNVRHARPAALLSGFVKDHRRDGQRYCKASASNPGVDSDGHLQTLT